MRFSFTLLLLLSFLLWGTPMQGEEKKFVLVLDAGHGGKEPGAKGKKSLEKNINLSVTLLVGEMIEKNHPDVKVIYTRKKDETVSLPKRSQIANKNKADLFISVHANSTAGSNKIKGAEVFTYGHSKTNANLEVLQRENEILYLEDEFRGMSIADFLNPVESNIIFEAMQAVYHESSFELATLIQKQLVTKAKRGNRGVKSDNFAVLRNASMPSVLIELDFISCPEAENYMISKNGQKTMANCIYDAFALYKKNLNLREQGLSGLSETQKKPNPETKPNKEGKVYKVQLLTSKEPVDPSLLRGYKADYYMEDGIYKYTYGESSDWNEIMEIRRSILKEFQDAFIITFENGVRVKK